MRRYIFTKWERGLLEEWIEDGEESQATRDLLSKIRKGWLDLEEDMTLIFKAIRTMMRRKRWRGRITGQSEFGSALQRAESALTRAKNV